MWRKHGGNNSVAYVGCGLLPAVYQNAARRVAGVPAAGRRSASSSRYRAVHRTGTQVLTVLCCLFSSSAPSRFRLLPPVLFWRTLSGSTVGIWAGRDEGGNGRKALTEYRHIVLFSTMHSRAAVTCLLVFFCVRWARGALGRRAKKRRLRRYGLAACDSLRRQERPVTVSRMRSYFCFYYSYMRLQNDVSGTRRRAKPRARSTLPVVRRGRSARAARKTTCRLLYAGVRQAAAIFQEDAGMTLVRVEDLLSRVSLSGGGAGMPPSLFLSVRWHAALRRGIFPAGLT